MINIYTNWNHKHKEGDGFEVADDFISITSQRLQVIFRTERED